MSYDVIGKRIKKKWVKEFIDEFTRFYASNSIKKCELLYIVTSSQSPDYFWYGLYPILISNLLKKFPGKEILKIEKNVVNRIFIHKEKEEEIILDFPGTLNLPKLKMHIDGHIFITNIRILIVTWKRKESYRGAHGLSEMSPYGTVAGALMSGVAYGLAHGIFKRKDAFHSAIKQFYDKSGFKDAYCSYLHFIPLTVPYNIIQNNNLTFMMNYDYIEKEGTITLHKICKIKFSLLPKQDKNETFNDFTRKREQLFLKIRDLFSQNPETVCNKCNHIQDKNLYICEKCGKKLINKL
ncbi:MAG: hypothetical protein ACFFB0_05435 [Promethearchaeota archaeon]